eukprot:TRINITY_DN2596_c0_g1_i1.p2 TRINITY_DN2596_c0_g1~~TRINITY_DN2596_c0_g1_i1.p2  ORF type:complete len:540 (+),score=283.04 TRINITY_DN2596_c0_g1_i1:160-1620(+)
MEALRLCSPFSSLPEDILSNTILPKLKKSTPKSGDVLCKQGESQPAVYIIQSGKITRIKDDATIDTLSSGSVAGLLHVFEKSPAFATLKVNEDATLYEISAEDFRSFLTDTSFVQSLLKYFAKELRAKNNILRTFSSNGKDRRFSVLCYDSKSYDIKALNEANKKAGDNFRIEYVGSRLDEQSALIAQGFSCVCAFVNDDLSAKVIRLLASAGVTLLAMRCAGYDNVDLEACKENNISVVRVPAYSPHAVAEHAISLIMALNRNIHHAYNRTKERNFALAGLMGFDMYQKTAGVIGTGKIGMCAVAILCGFGCKVVCFDKYRNKEIGSGIYQNASYVDELEELLAASDVITIHAPLLESTKHMINKDTISKTKKGVILINTSRGPLINSADLVDGLQSGQIGGAGLDVLEQEETLFFEDHSGAIIDNTVFNKLVVFPNVIITGHQAFFTQEAISTIASTTVGNIHTFFHEKKSGKDHPNAVEAEYK